MIANFFNKGFDIESMMTFPFGRGRRLPRVKRFQGFALVNYSNWAARRVELNCRGENEPADVCLSWAHSHPCLLYTSASFNYNFTHLMSA